MNATLGNKSFAIGTIVDDDLPAVPELSIDDVTVTEGDSGTKVAAFTVELSFASSQTVTVDYASANGSASSGSDYVSASNTLTFTSGQTTKTVNITVNSDTTPEATEDFFVNLLNPSNATLDAAVGWGTITNDDVSSAPTVSISDETVTEGNAGAVLTTFTVTLSSASSQTVIVNYSSQDGTATDGEDYIGVLGGLTFNPGQASKTITVQVNSDAVVESDETFFIRLDSPVNATIARETGRGTILNDDYRIVPSLNVEGASVGEGNSGARDLFFTVRLSRPSDLPVTVDFATADDTATAGSDYVSRSGGLTFIPGETSKILRVAILGDTNNEADEKLTLTVFSPGNAAIQTSTATGVIANDDSGGGTIQGRVFNDFNNDGEAQTDESGLEGIAVYLDSNRDGDLDGGEPSQLTDVEGKYEFTGLANGSYQVRQVLQTGWAQSYPTVPSGLRQVTNNTDSDIYAQTNGLQITWETQYSGGTQDVWIDDAGQQTKLTAFPLVTSGNGAPQMDGSEVVFGLVSGTNNQIFLRTNDNTIQLTNNTTSSSERPQIDRGQAVWMTWNGATSLYDVFQYDGLTITQLSVNDGFDDLFPQIDAGRVVWTRAIVGGPNNVSEIMYFDGTNTLQLTNNSVADTEPQIDAGQIVWSSWDGNDWEIFLYDGSSVRQLTNNTADDIYPRISAGQVAWKTWDGNDFDVYFYDGSAIVQLTNNSTSDSDPWIDNGRIVWSGYDPATDSDDVFFHDAFGTINVSNRANHDREPRISGNKVVWFGSDGSDNEIFEFVLYDAQSIQITNDRTAADVNFGTYPLQEIRGQKYNDLNGDGVRNDGEPGLAGWMVELDIGNDGTVEQTTVTDADGTYSFADIQPGSFRIGVVPEASWFSTTPDAKSNGDGTGGASGGGGADLVDDDFGAFLPVMVSGTTFHDVDGDGLLSAGDLPLAGWSVELDLLNDGIVDATTTSDASGYYSFLDVGPGTHSIREIPLAGWTPESPTSGMRVVTMTSGQALNGADFANSNNPPTISNIADQTTNEDTATPVLFFNVGDQETSPSTLIVTATSSNQTLVPNANIALGGSGVDRTIIVTPALNRSGSTTITVTVSDGVFAANDTFVLTVNYDPSALAQFLVDSAHRYDHSINPSDLGSPAVFLFTDYFAGGSYTNITATGGLAADGLDGNDPDAARGTSSFRMTTSTPNGYFEFGLGKSNNSPRDIPEYGAVHSLRFWAKGDSDGQTLQVKLLQGLDSGFSFLVVEQRSLTSEWAEYVVSLPASPTLAPKDVYAVQFQLPSAGTIRLDDVRLNTDGTDPLQLIQSYVPGGWASNNSPPNSTELRDLIVYPNRSFLYDVALASKALIASGEPVKQTLGLRQLNAVLATEPDGANGYFNERSSGYVLLADGSARIANTQRRTVGDNAWFGLSLLDAFRLTGDELYLLRARELSEWFELDLKATGPLEGYFGGYDANGNAVPWRATEFNIDAFELNHQIAALLTLRGENSAAQVYKDRATHAGTFVVGMFEATGGKFWTGTTTGDTINTSSVPLDAQLWPILTLQLSTEYATALDWMRALQYAETHLVQTDGELTGFSFSTNSTTNRVWPEGVGQGVSAYHILGDSVNEQTGLRTLEQMVVPGGGALAVSSGTMADSSLGSVYDARQAIAPSAWSYLVHLGRNPFADSVPGNHAPLIGNIVDQATNEELATGLISFTVADIETAAASLIVGGSSSNTVLVPNGNIEFNGTGANRTVRITPAADQTGTAVITVTVSDGTATASDTFRLTVSNTNDAPTLANAILDQPATEDAPYSFQFAANTFADVDLGDSLTYTANGLPGWLSFAAATRTFSGTPVNADVGFADITVTAKDTSDATATDTFRITVANTNDAPTVANVIPDQDATEDAAFSFQFAANTFADVDVGDSLMYSAGGMPGWLSFDAATRTFSGTPLNADVAFANIIVTAKDPNDATVTDVFRITVANTNDAPTVANAIPDQSAPEDAVFSFQFAANTFADVDIGDSLTYSVSGLPGWLSFDAATRTFRGTALNADVAFADVTVTAKDGSNATATDTFRITVVNTNDEPTLANPIVDPDATEDAAFSFTVPANTFADVDVGDSLTLSAAKAGSTALPSWLSFTATTGAFTGTPLDADVGSFNVTVAATDGSGASVSDTFTITVINTKEAPNITWANPADITFSTLLGNSQLNATANTAGTFVYTPASGTQLNAGVNQQLSVNFTPTDTANFNTAAATVTINVAKATPAITWNNPADITFGTLLGSTELNASADVAGSFVYNPAGGTQLNAGSNQQLSVNFTPTDTVNFNTATATVTINVAKATPRITWNNPADITFGTLLGETQLNATADTAGTFVYTPASGTQLNAGVNQQLSVNFTPTDTANFNTAAATVTLNVGKATPVITWNSPADNTFGTLLGDTQLNASADVAGSFVYAPASGTQLNAGANQQLSVNFTPTDTVNFNTATATVTINVAKATPTITWNNPADITFGMLLGDTQLNATANAVGTFIYTPASGTQLNAGVNQQLSVNFTSTDTANFNAATATVTINVAKATPNITWANPADITFGMLLGDTHLNATADAAGTFVYTPANGTQLNAGANQQLSVAFTPTDSANFNNITANVLIDVLSADLVITWNNPADITFGMLLGDTQLNATADTAGTFVYSPASGTQLNAGPNQQLSVNFTPTDVVNFNSATDTVTINVGKATPTIAWNNPADITFGTLLGDTQLNATANTAGTFVYTPASGTQLNAGPNQQLSVNFTPTDTANFNTATANVTINVAKATPNITWANPADVTFGMLLGDTQLNATAHIAGSFVYTPAGGTQLNAGSNQQLSVNFTPTDTANFNSATATITINVGKATPTITWNNPADITFGTLLGDTQLNATANTAGTSVYHQASGTQLNAGLNQQLSVDFTPTDLVNFNTATANVTINVAKATPTITWANPADITFGTRLDGTQLNATTDTAGTFVYTPASGTQLNAGPNQQLSVNFTPTDTVNFNAAAANVLINVSKATPVVTWNNPADITFGRLLGDTQLNATADTAGTFVYTPASGTQLNAGVNQQLSVNFTPTDLANFNTATSNVTINVAKATPTIAWNNPADITFGTLLDDTQLNATADTAGTFVYTPASGTQLNAGVNQQLSVNFTPTDLANFNTATANVTIDVLPTDPVIADAGGPYSIDAGVALQLDGSSSTGAGTLSYRWDFNNDGTADFTMADAISTVPWLTLANLGLGAGQHTIKLIVADNSGTSPAVTASLTISSTFVFDSAASGAQSNQFTLSRTNNQIEIRETNPPNTLLSSVSADGVQQVNVTGTSNDDTLTVDYTNGDPLPTGGVTFAGAAGRDTFVIGGHDVTLDLTNQNTYRFTDVEVLNIVGASPNTLTLDQAAVLGVTDANDTLTVLSDFDETVNLGTGWQITGTAVDGGEFVRVLTNGAGTLRLVGPRDWTNPVNALDTNGSGEISPLDVLLIINEVNSPQFSNADRSLVDAAGLTTFPGFFYDTSPDGVVVPLDVLVVINFLNEHTGGGEGEGNDAADEVFAAIGRGMVERVGSLLPVGNHLNRRVQLPRSDQHKTPDPVSAPSLTEVNEPSRAVKRVATGARLSSTLEDALDDIANDIAAVVGQNK